MYEGQVNTKCGSDTNWYRTRMEVESVLQEDNKARGYKSVLNSMLINHYGFR